MTDTRTSSMLQRIPAILAVTAASYGLQLPAELTRHNPTRTHAQRTSTEDVPSRIELPALTRARAAD